MIGIWWDDGTRIVTFRVAVEAVEAGERFCDSGDSHDGCWPIAASQMGISPQEEYFSVPRGRVIYDRLRQTAIIYHGNQTTRSRLALIAAEFQLERWESQLDTHYLIGSEVDQLFDDFD